MQRHMSDATLVNDRFRVMLVEKDLLNEATSEPIELFMSIQSLFLAS